MFELTIALFHNGLKCLPLINDQILQKQLPQNSKARCAKNVYIFMSCSFFLRHIHNRILPQPQGISSHTHGKSVLPRCLHGCLIHYYYIWCSQRMWEKSHHYRILPLVTWKQQCQSVNTESTCWCFYIRSYYRFNQCTCRMTNIFVWLSNLPQYCTLKCNYIDPLLCDHQALPVGFRGIFIL